MMCNNLLSCTGSDLYSVRQFRFSQLTQIQKNIVSTVSVHILVTICVNDHDPYAVYGVTALENL